MQRCDGTKLRVFAMLFIVLCITGCSGASGLNRSRTESPFPALPKAQTSEIKYGTSLKPTTFATPLPLKHPAPHAEGTSPTELKPKVRDDIRGVYVSANALYGDRWSSIQALIRKKKINALVVDVKNDYGRVTYPSSVRTVSSIEADSAAKIKDIAALINKLKQQKVYLIARIVTFKDPYLAVKKPEWAMKRKDGNVWRDRKGVSWIDPYNESTWEYNISLAEEAIRNGFDEVQFDYVRFPEQAGAVNREVLFQNERGETKDQIIQRFLREATHRIHRLGGVVSADVFGLTTTTKDGMGIGQKWELLSLEVDVLSPMIYPSHYASGSYGVKHPDLRPYSIVKEAVEDAIARNEGLKSNGEAHAMIRPWIQDFTAKWVHPHQVYREKQVEEQIRALEQSGIRQYLLWNPSSKYSLSLP